MLGGLAALDCLQGLLAALGLGLLAVGWGLAVSGNTALAVALAAEHGMVGIEVLRDLFVRGQALRSSRWSRSALRRLGNCRNSQGHRGQPGNHYSYTRH